MNALQIVIRTIVTTIDLLLVIAMLKTKGLDEGVVKATTTIILVNLVGVWI